jgi:hypothetical protein
MLVLDESDDASTKPAYLALHRCNSPAQDRFVDFEW